MVVGKETDVGDSVRAAQCHCLRMLSSIISERFERSDVSLSSPAVLIFRFAFDLCLLLPTFKVVAERMCYRCLTLIIEILLCRAACTHADVALMLGHYKNKFPSTQTEAALPQCLHAHMLALWLSIRRSAFLWIIVLLSPLCGTATS